MSNTAKVVGVLHYNDATRDELLKRLNWRKDYLENFTPDTKLDRIANEIFTQELAIATYANNDRNLVRKYITPELVNFYGSSPGLNTKLAKYSFGQDYTGRISDIDEANVKFEHEYLDYLLKDNVEGIERLADEDMAAPRKQLLNMLIDAGRLKGDSMYYLSQANRYVEFRQAMNDDIQGTIVNEDDFTNDNTYYTSSEVLAETQFDEGDYLGQEGDGQVTSNDTFLAIYSTPREKPKSLLSRTNDLFNKHKISTLAARFHTSSEIRRAYEVTDTAKSFEFGNSHGRNLLKKNPYENIDTNGYENPYCRVWTYHHQYDRMTRLIRPFTESDDDGNTVVSDAVYEMDPYKAEYKSASNGRDYLKANTVLGRNGRVTIAPKGDCGKINTEIKKCMFSIENLAWKDVPRNMGYISKEQRGPNGGRIMWFPPYDLDFSESVQVDWNQSKFIGRGEPVFTYSNTTRQGQLSFVLLIDHPSIIDNIPKYNIKDGDTTEDGKYVEDEDVLRFFAGCQVPSLKKQIECPDDDPGSQQGNGDEPAEDIPTKDKSVHVKFYVYYPNNYSGNSVKISRDQWAQSGSSDRSWFEYILYGQNTILDDVVNGWGYETSASAGISFGNDSHHSEPVYATCKDWESGEGKLEKDDSGCKIYYKYRVDFDLHQKLHNRLPGQKEFSRSGCSDPSTSNYYDSKTFQLNSSKSKLPTDATHTFQEIVRTMFSANKDLFAPLKNVTNDSHAYHVDENDPLLKAFKNKKITKVHIKAGATKQDNPHTDLLAMRRARAVKDLLITYGNVDPDVFDNYEPVISPDLKDKTDINSLEAKLQRFASVDLWFDDPEIVKLSETTHTTEGTVDGAEGTGWHLVEDNEKELIFRDDIEPAVHVEEGKKPVASAKITQPEMTRYETEAEYFRNIELTAPFVYRSIIEKFKYFNPAFHSMSPEGFNARLTFLQQCTRQGHTISATDLSYAKTAGNLAFGRMPVCVLRIGDFINTKIIINSMSITYGAAGNPQWDLNPEGIGVQPMYAKVQLGIVIIGGQSLEGPINRLQNAVSFNYYANTGVYDNRSDRVGVATEKRVFSGDGEYVREETVETSGDKLKVWDESEYEYTKTVYNNIWTPYPNLRVKDDYNNDIASYNEYKAKGGSSGVEKDEHGRYRLKQ